MFGANEIVGRKAFMTATPGTLLATSLFYTLQGEGPYAGRPAIFLRLTKCNLACSFCDTFFDAGDVLTFEEIELRMTLLLRERGVEHMVGGIGLVITGGEPMLQPNLVDFLERCHQFAWVQIETNGTQWLPIPDDVTLVVSPKCAEKDGHALRYLTPQDRILERANALKFVMSADPESPYSDVPPWIYEWSAFVGKMSDVYISPMNVYNRLPQAAKAMRFIGKEVAAVPDMHMRSTVDEVISFWEPGLLNMEANERNHRYAAYFCMTRGFRLNLQMHLYAGIA